MFGIRHNIFIIVISVFVLSSCRDDMPGDTVIVDDSLTDIPYNPQAYVVDVPTTFPLMEIPMDNQLTQEGVQLGRRLFYDPLLSADGTMSCSSCHQIDKAFSDPLPTSVGIDGIAGPRSGMSLLNIGFFYDGLNWDGSIATLEEQALEPVRNPIELHEDWDNVIEKLKVHDDYPQRFRKAFGIENKSEITKELAAMALAQFERIIISGGNSRFDKNNRGEIFFTDAEFNGYDMFFDLSPSMPDAECAHCHGGPLFTTNEYINNGLDEALDLNDFIDKGRGAVTGYVFDNGKFRVPSLRNIELSAPYMHDGRFQTLEEVIDHYDSGGHYADNVDPLIYNIGLSQQNKDDLLAFLKTLTDTTYLQNPDLQNPFE